MSASVQLNHGLLFQCRAFANDDATPFEDTKKRGKPIVYLFGSRPFTAGLCLGVEKGMRGMKAGQIVACFGALELALRRRKNARALQTDHQLAP